MGGVVFRINVKPQTPGEHGLPKMPVESARFSPTGVEGDFNRYRQEKLNGDPDSAVLLMPLEMIQELNSEGWPLRTGDIGENITTRGISYGSFQPGKSFSVGGAEIQVSRACNPCTNLYLLPYVGRERGPAFLKTMLGRRGWYARVSREGVVRRGDRITEARQN